MPFSYRRFSFILLLLFSLVLLAGCGRNRAATAPDSQQPATSDSQPSEEQASDESTGEEQVGQESESSDTTNSADAPAAESSVPESDDSANASGDGLVITTIEETESINSYRARILTSAIGPERSDVVTITAAYIKSPPAQHIQALFNQNGQALDGMEMITVEGQAYILTGDNWMQAPSATFNIDELTVISPDDLAANSGMNLEEIGTETISDRQTVHYRGAKEAIPVAQAGSDTLDVSQAEQATVDLWIDAELDFIVQMLIQVSAPSDSGPINAFEILFTYSDFNGDIIITPPDSAAEIPVPPTPEGASLSALLGFEPELPEGANVTFYGGGRIAAVLMPVPFEEGFPLITQQMLDNGYTELSTQNMSDTERIVTFQRDTKVVALTIFANDQGGTSVNIGGG